METNSENEVPLLFPFNELVLSFIDHGQRAFSVGRLASAEAVQLFRLRHLDVICPPQTYS